jgi:hypothetical protein
MARCDTLVKTHLSWWVATDVNMNYLYEYARLTGSISLNGHTEFTQDQIDAFVQLADSLSGTAGSKKVSLAITYSPYQQSPAIFSGTDPTAQQTSSIAELDTLRDRLSRIRIKIAAANIKFASDSVKVKYLLYDQELFDTGNSTGQAWTDSLTSKMNACYSRGLTAFPDAKVIWYDRGGMSVTSGDPDGWIENACLALNESGTNFTCSLYRPFELQDMRDTFRYTLENANRHGVSYVTCYLSLGAGYARGGTAPTTFQTWDNDLDYGRWYAWQLGREINNSWWGASVRWLRFAPWDYCDTVIFYNSGGPFADACPHFGEYFCAYVWGANNTQTAFPSVVLGL